MPSTKGGSLNGGIIGKTNSTSFGKNKTTKVTASGCYTTPPPPASLPPPPPPATTK